MTTTTTDLYTLCQCDKCPLQCAPIRGAGKRDASLFIVADTPGWHEMRENRPLVGAAGQLLDHTLIEAGTERKETFVTYAVACRSKNALGEDVPPPKEAIAACRPRLLAEIEEVRPKAILTVGTSAAASMFPGKQRLSELEGVAGRYKGIPMLPTYNPAIVMHGQEELFEGVLTTVKRVVRLASGAMTLPPEDEKIFWEHVQTPERINYYLSSILKGDFGYALAIDVETDGLDTTSAALLLIAIGNDDGGIALEVPGRFGASSSERRSLGELLEDSRFTWSMHNSSFDIQILKREFGVVPPHIVDTLCLAMGTTEIAQRIGLKTQARTWLNAGFYEKEVRDFVSKEENSWENVPRDILAKYAVYDVVMTQRLRSALTPLCVEEGTLDLAFDLLMPAQRFFAEVESHGVLVDLTYLNVLEAEWTPRIEAARTAVSEFAALKGWKQYEKITTKRDRLAFGYQGFIEQGLSEEKALAKSSELRGLAVPLNPNSPKQLHSFVFDHLKMSLTEGNRSTDAAWRRDHAGHPFVEVLEDYQLANHMMSSYVHGISKHVRADGRVHPNFKIFGARTGRLSMGDPALQTIPREGSLIDKKTGVRKFDSIKRMFLPSPGHVWVDTDFSQLELRVLWHLTQDEGLGEAIMSGDFHAAMASKSLKKPMSEITEEERHDSKRVTFGTVYGRQAPAIADQLGCSVETAQYFIDSLFASAPKFHKWYLEQQQNALETGRSVTAFGRVRRWHLITKNNKHNVLNQSVNFPAQSLASDLNLAAAIRIQPMLTERRLGSVLFLVHDAICAEVREGREREAIELIQSEMVKWPFPSCATLAVESKLGVTWGDVKVWEG